MKNSYGLCCTCRYWFTSLGKTEPLTMGECRRYPPVWVFSWIGKNGEVVYPAGEVAYPITDQTKGCGEFKENGTT